MSKKTTPVSQPLEEKQIPPSNPVFLTPRSYPSPNFSRGTQNEPKQSPIIHEEEPLSHSPPPTQLAPPSLSSDFFSTTAEYRDLLRKCLDLDLIYARLHMDGRPTPSGAPHSFLSPTEGACIWCRNCPCRQVTSDTSGSKKRKQSHEGETAEDPDKVEKRQPNKKRKKSQTGN